MKYVQLYLYNVLKFLKQWRYNAFLIQNLKIQSYKN